ncbi:MAG: PAS domain-containing protein [Proteobacteria bacterium]|nr:PAS domain-containing protein [Pseudomonadota bacterium]
MSEINEDKKPEDSMPDGKKESRGTAVRPAAKSTVAKMAVTGTVLLIAAVVGIFAALQFVESQRDREVQRWQDRLSIIIDSRRDVIEKWITAQIEEVRAITDPNVTQGVGFYVEQAVSSGSKVTESPELQFLQNLLNSRSQQAGFLSDIKGAGAKAATAQYGYSGLGIVSLNGDVLVASDSFPPVTDELRAIIAKAPKKTTAMSEIYHGPDNVPSIAFTAPIASETDPEKSVGLVVGVKVYGKELFPLLKQPGNVDKTAEAVLLRLDGRTIQYISPLLDGTKALQRKLNLDTPDLAAAFAIDGKEQFAIRRDYREKDVLLVHRAVEGSPWRLMYKIDSDESLAEAEERLRNMILGFVGLIVLLLIAFVAIWFKGASKRATEAAEMFQTLATRFEGQRNFMHLVTDSQPNSVIVFDEEGKYRWFNQVALTLTGMERGDLFDKSVVSVLGPQQGRRIERWVQDVLMSNEPMSVTHDVLVAGKGEITYKSDLIPLPAREDFPPGVLMVSQDISEVMAERARRERILKQLVRALVSVVDRRDPFSANHSTRVAEVSRSIADEMNLDYVDVETVEISGSLMNLGKIEVPSEVLTKQDKLTDEEMAMIRQSVFTSAELIKDIEFDGSVEGTLRQLQESFDGSGGPTGLKGDEILVTARVVAVANAFVGMVSARSWRPGMNFDKAVDILLSEVGKSFDRKVVTALANHLDNSGGREKWRRYGLPPKDTND